MPLVLACLQHLDTVGRLSLIPCSRALSSCLQADLEAATLAAAGHQHLNRSTAMQEDRQL